MCEATFETCENEFYNKVNQVISIDKSIPFPPSKFRLMNIALSVCSCISEAEEIVNTILNGEN